MAVPIIITVIGVLLVVACFWVTLPPEPVDVKFGWWRTRGGALCLVVEYDPYDNQHYPWKGYVFAPSGRRSECWPECGFSTALGDRVYSPTDLEEYLGLDAPKEIEK